jgi:hypothetical protein
MSEQAHRQLGRTSLAILLLPVLAGFLWLEVVIGTEFTWQAVVGYVSPSQPSIAGGIIGTVATSAGPIVTVILTLTAKSKALNNTDRLLRIESWGISVAVPIALFGLVFTAMGSFM